MTKALVLVLMASMNGRIALAPRAQFRPRLERKKY